MRRVFPDRITNDCTIVAYVYPQKGWLVGATTALCSFWLLASTQRGSRFDSWAPWAPCKHIFFSNLSSFLLCFCFYTFPTTTTVGEFVGLIMIYAVIFNVYLMSDMLSYIFIHILEHLISLILPWNSFLSTPLTADKQSPVFVSPEPWT